MAVARPQVYRPRFTGAGGGYRTELGQALGNVAGALQRREDRREREEQERKAKEARLKVLRARNELYDVLEDAGTDGTFDGMDVAGVQRWGEEEIEKRATEIARLDEEKAEEFKLQSRKTLAAYTSTKRTQEEQQAAAAVLSVYGEQEMRFARDVPMRLRDAMSAATQGEREAAWGEVQALHHDAVTAAQDLPEGDKRNKALADIEAKMNGYRFDAGVNHAVHTNTAFGPDGFFSRIANGKDFIDGTDGQARWSEGISPEHVALRRRQAVAAARAAREDRIARLKEAKIRQSADQEARRQEILVQVDQGTIPPEQGITLLTLASDPVGSDLVRDFALEKAEDTGKLRALQLQDDPAVKGMAQRMAATISLSLDEGEIRRMRTEAILMEGAGRLGEPQKQLIVQAADSQLGYVQNMQENMDEQQRQILRDVKQAYQAIYEGAGLIGVGYATLAPAPEIAFYSSVQPAVEEFLLQNGADANQIRTVVEMLPVWWAQSREMREVAGTEGDDQFMNQDVREPAPKDMSAMMGTLKALGQSGIKVETDREWNNLALRPELSGVLANAYDEQDMVMPGAAITAMEAAYGRERAEHLYEEVVLPSQMIRLMMAGHVPGIDMATNMDKWMKHWRHL